MKKTFKYALAVVAAVATVACSQFDEQDIAPEVGGENMVPMTITVGNEPTRVNIGDDSKSINWTAGDKLAIFEGTSYSSYSDAGKTKLEYSVVESSINGTSATFTGLASEDETKFYVLYPFESVDSRTAAKRFKMVLPSTQQIGDSNIDEKALLSAGYFVAPNSAVLYNVTGFLRVDITFDDVESVVVCGNKLAGDVEIQKNYSPVTDVPTVYALKNAVNTVTLLPKGEVFEKGSYWVALLPGTTPVGEFSVTFNRTSQKVTTYSSTKDVVIERNKGFFIADYKWEKQDLVIKDAATLTEFLTNSVKYGKAEFANDINLEGVTLPVAENFTGELDCKGFALKNWNATAPLFAKLGGAVKNLVIDESCTLAPADAAGAFGFVAKSVTASGSLENITNNVAAITLDATKYGAGSSQTEDAVYFGTLAGECYGAVKNCVNNSNITITTNPTGDDIRGMVYIGGLVGLLDTADDIAANAEFVSMSKCENNGDIAYTVASGRGGFLFLGGLVGGTTATKLASSTTNKAKIDGCTNKGVISHIYPETATAIGAKTKDNSNFTYVAGVIGYCEGTVSNCVNGVGTTLDVTIPTVKPSSVTNDAVEGAITVTTPTLASGFVVANAAVAGVAGMALMGGDSNKNFAPIYVAGSYGPGTVGSSQLGGGSQNGVSVAGVIGQTGISSNFKSSTLSNSHNYGAVTVDFPMADDTATFLYVGGVVGYGGTSAATLSNNGKITVESSANAHYIGGVLGHNYGSVNGATNNADVEVELVCNGGKHIANSNNNIGGVVGMIPSASNETATNLTNNNATTVTVSGSAAVEGDVFIGGVAAKSNIAASNLTNKKAVTVTAGTVENLTVGGVCGVADPGCTTSTNHAAVTVNAASIPGDYLVVGGLCGTSEGAMASSVNKGAVSATLTGAALKAYVGGLVGYSTAKLEATDCHNEATGTVNFSAAEAELTELSVAGITGRSYAKAVYTRCENMAPITVAVKSAKAAHLAGIEGAPNSAAIGSTNGASTDSCVSKGTLTATGSALWYVGGVSSWGGVWTSTASSQMKALNNVAECNINVCVEGTTLGHYVGGIVGFSGLHTTVSGNSYKGAIKVGTNSSTVRSFVGGIVAAHTINQTSGTSPKNGSFTFEGNVAEADITCGANANSTYAGMILGGVDNVSTKEGSTFTKKSDVTVTYDDVNVNKVKSGCKLDGVAVTAETYLSLVMGSYNDAERFNLIENNRATVIFE